MESLDKFADRIKRGERVFQPNVCAICGRQLQSAVTGARETARGWVDDDCYFRELGKVVEQSPIATPKGVKGGD